MVLPPCKHSVPDNLVINVSIEDLLRLLKERSVKIVYKKGVSSLLIIKNPKESLKDTGPTQCGKEV
jgi:hypothetical protein